MAFYCLHPLQKKKKEKKLLSFLSHSPVLYYSRCSSFYRKPALLRTVTYLVHAATQMPYGFQCLITLTGAKRVMDIRAVQGASYPA